MKALSVARRQSAKLSELRAATSLARLWRDQGKPTEARDLLAPVYNWFTEGLDTPVLKEAKVLLDELSGSPAAVVSRTLTQPHPKHTRKDEQLHPTARAPSARYRRWCRALAEIARRGVEPEVDGSGCRRKFRQELLP